MKLIIDIPEELYNGIECRNPELETEYVCHELMKAVDNGTPLDDVKVKIENAITLHMGMVGYVEAEKVIDILEIIGKAESEET